MKMITTCSKVAHKAVLGVGSTLRKFSKSSGECSLREGSWELYNFSSKPIWLLIQFTKL